MAPQNLGGRLRILKAEILTIGTELLLGEIVDTNAAFLSRVLAACGIGVYYKSTVVDNLQRMVAAIKQAIGRTDLVITSGGLGPTSDDLTKEAVALALGRKLVFSSEAAAMVSEKFAHRHSRMSSNNQRQAQIPEGAKLIPNEWGTAPGIICEFQGCTVICLPGVPVELEGMTTKTVVPYLQSRLSGKGGVIHSRTIRFFGIGESSLEEELADILQAQTNPTIALYAGSGEVRIRVTAFAATTEEAEALIDPIEAAIKDRVGEYAYGYGDDNLEGATARLLTEGGYTLAVAESCTGGLVSHRLTNIPGSSAFYMRGAITYSNEAKEEVLGVPRDVLNQHGAVSWQTAVAMAEGVKRWAQTDFGVGVTGIAGPGGGTPEKPVGLVYAAVAGPGQTQWREFRFYGDREMIKHRTASNVINMLRLYILSLQ